MGLWRRQIAQPQEAEQFDIRGIVHEFKISVLAYVHWREGMDIEVSHVKRKDIPKFVFPGGVRPPRSSRTAGRNSCAVSRNDVTADGQVGNPVGTESWSDPQSAQDRFGGYQGIPLLASGLSSRETPNILNGHLNLHTETVEHQHPGRFLGSTSAPVHNAVVDVVTQANSMPSPSSNGGPHVSSLEGCSETILGQTCNLSSHGNNHLKRKAEEELEPLELAGPSVRAASTSTVQRKPLRLRLSTLPQPKQAA
jgi:poly(A) polymerase